MLLTQGALKNKSAELSAEIAAARSARNLATRRRRDAEAEEREADRHRRRRKRRDDREFDRLIRLSARVRTLPEERPRIGVTTARKLYHRTTGILLGTTGLSDARGPDGLYSLHFGFTARGFASTAGRRWRAGEAERAARYIVREDGLEDGERGWWSNIADDRVELVAFFRTIEAVERHDRKNANVYCSEIIALPAELTAPQRREAVARICGFFKLRGLPYVTAIHLPDEAGDQRNFHCHIIYSLRPAARNHAYDWTFALGKAGDINTPQGILARRHQVVQDINTVLRAAGIEKRYTPLSNKARRIAEAQGKIGQNGVWASRRLAAMEARETLLGKVRSIAGHVQTSLIAANSALSRLRGGIVRLQADYNHRAAIARNVHTRVIGSAAQLETLRKRVEQRLAQRRQISARVSVVTRMAVQRCRLPLLSDLDARRIAIRRASDLANRTCRADRRIELQRNLDAVAVVCRQLTGRLERAATVAYGHMQNAQAQIGVAETQRKDRIARTKTNATDIMVRRRRLLTTKTIETLRYVVRFGNRVQDYQAMMAKQRLLENAKLNQDQRALALRQHRQLVIVRANTMTVVVRNAEVLASRIAACRHFAVDRTQSMREIVLGHDDKINDALAAARVNGARLLTVLGKGPQPEEATPAIATVAPTSEHAAPPLAKDNIPAAGKARDTASPATKRRNDDHDVIRDIMRRHKPAETMEMFPPPTAERTSFDPELIRQRARDMEMLRAEVRRREKRVRAELRERALHRLSRLDIEIAPMPDGNYAVAAGILTLDEIRVLMDTALHKETQHFLARIARLQREARTIVAPPFAEHIPSADEEFERLLRQRQFLAGRSGKGQG